MQNINNELQKKKTEELLLLIHEYTFPPINLENFTDENTIMQGVNLVIIMAKKKSQEDLFYLYHYCLHILTNLFEQKVLPINSSNINTYKYLLSEMENLLPNIYSTNTNIRIIRIIQ